MKLENVLFGGQAADVPGADGTRRSRFRLGLVASQRKLLALRDYGIVVAFGAVLAVLSVSSSQFLTTVNLANILDQAAPLAIIAAGTTLVIVAGGFDLSSGAIFAVSGIAAAVVSNHIGVALGVLAAVGLGALLGTVNGLIVTRLRVHSFLATLASSLVIRGAGLLLAGGSLVIAEHEDFRAVARSPVLGLRSAVLVALGFALCAAVLLARTYLGEAIYAVGGNAEAARLAGIDVERVRVVTFAISGIAAGIAGVVGASRVGGGHIGAGVGLEFTAITAVVVGGTSIFGGDGAVWRTMVGLLLLTVISNGFNLSEINPVYQQLVLGGILLAAVALDARLRGAET